MCQWICQEKTAIVSKFSPMNYVLTELDINGDTKIMNSYIA